MQDWFTDSHESFARTVETMLGLYDGDFEACATCEEQPWFSFFFDGTGNNRDIDRPLNKLSNVARLHLGHVKGEEPLINDFYYPGIGTPLNASDPTWWENLRDSEVLGGGLGLGWDVRLTTAEKEFNEYLKYNHRVTRIDIAVFGFSRGATLARAFVNRLLSKCTMKDGVPHWPCGTALDGESAPLHIRFLGLFDTVESVGLPAHNLSDMLVHIPEQVERCCHIVSGHELRACFPMTPVGDTAASCDELVFPGVHSDIGGGYRPNEQGRSDLLGRLALNRMRLEAVMCGVPFTPPTELAKTTADLFEYDEELKSLFDEYMATIGRCSGTEDQVFRHMRLFYGWLKVRFGHAPCELYENMCSTDPEIQQALQRIQQYHGRLKVEADTMNWRSYLTQLWNTDRSEYLRTVETAGGRRETNEPLSADELAYWKAWLNPPELSANLIRFFDRYVHDSRAGFIRIDGGGYLLPRQLVAVASPESTPAPPSEGEPATHAAPITPSYSAAYRLASSSMQ